MATFRLKRLSSPEVLREVSTARLLQFLSPYRDYLNDRGFDFPASNAVDDLDYTQLATIFVNSDDATPDGLVADLCLIEEMATPEAMDALVQEAKSAGLNMAPGDEQSPADVALHICLSNKAILERKHSERSITRARVFESFQVATLPAPSFRMPGGTQVKALEAALDVGFEAMLRGQYARVFVFERADGDWFLVRHGDPFRREERTEGKGTASIAFRPVKYDALHYIASHGELRINARSKWEKELYCAQFGKHFFGNEALFKPVAKYTLEPLRLYRATSLNCLDVKGIEEIRLTEIEFMIGGPRNARYIHKADDVFADMDDRRIKMPERAKITRAVFRIKFEDAKATRSVVIRPPRTATYARDGDSSYVEEWLQSRGFVAPAGRRANQPNRVLAST